MSTNNGSSDTEQKHCVIPTTCPSAANAVVTVTPVGKQPTVCLKRSLETVIHLPFGMKTFVFEKSKNGVDVITLDHNLTILDGTPGPDTMFYDFPQGFQLSVSTRHIPNDRCFFPPRPFVSLRTRHTEPSGLTACAEN